MAMYAGKLLQQPAMNNPTIVVVTDRNDLDGQLFGQFSAAKDLLRQTPEQAESREELREKLAARQSGGIIFATVQKFSLLDGEQDHPVLCDRRNVVVISDEAHRSQYGMKARLDTKTGQYVFGFAKHMRDALPAAAFIGFTGTPIANEDRDTRGVFGDYVSIYDIQDAVNDRATVQIYYESRLAKLDINSAEIEKLNQDVEEVIEDEEDIAARENTKSTWAELAKLVGAKPRLEEVAADLVAHFEKRTEVIEGKGMIVAMSRDICVALFDEIITLRPGWAGSKIVKDGKVAGYNPEDGAIRIIMTGNATDRPGLQEHVFTKTQRKRLEKRFKDAGRSAAAGDRARYVADGLRRALLPYDVRGQADARARADAGDRPREPRLQGQAGRAGGRLHRHWGRSEKRAANLYGRQGQGRADRKGRRRVAHPPREGGPGSRDAARFRLQRFCG